MEENKSEIMVSENTIVEKEEFVKLHEYIFHCGRMTCEFAIEMAKKLKEMRDGKLYLAAGIKTFGDYVSTMLGMKERQAYNYIKVYEELPEEFLHSNAKIGITKLTLLASISSVNRDEIIEKESIEDISVNDLKEKIKELETKTEKLKSDLKVSEENLYMKNNKIKSLELKNKEDVEETQKIAHEIISKLKKEKETLQEKISKLNSVQKETIYEKNPELEKSLELANEELAKKEKEIEMLNKKLMTSDNSMTIFKLKFEDFQKVANELLQAFSNVPEEKKKNCEKAIQTVLEGLKVC